MNIIPGERDYAENQRLIREAEGCVAAIQRVRYLRLLRELREGVNPEINTDKQALVTGMEQLGFRKDIAEAFQEVDRKLISAASTFDFRGCMDLSRAAFEKIVEVVQPDLRARHPSERVLQNCGVVDEKEAELLQKFYNYVSSSGSHDLGSAPDEARVTKNITIELGLLVVNRVKALTSAP